MNRRRFMSLAAGAAMAQSWPRAAHAQQATMPVIGFLNSASSNMFEDRLGAFRQGLKDTGHIEGENVAIAYRWGDNQMDRLAELVADLVRRPVAVLVATGRPAALAAKAANA